MRRIRWRLFVWRRFGVIWCRDCHHRWKHHYAHGFRINHPLDPEDWDVEYGCEGCNRAFTDCKLIAQRDEAEPLGHRESRTPIPGLRYSRLPWRARGQGQRNPRTRRDA